jgi:hypothetical protein
MAKNIPVRVSGIGMGSTITNGSFAQTHEPTCHPSETTEAIILFTIASIGGVSNLLLMILVIVKKPFKRYHKRFVISFIPNC